MGAFPNPNAVNSNFEQKKPKAVSDGIIPRAPSWLGVDAKKIYKNISKEIVDLGVGGSCDANVLAILAMQLSRLQELSQKPDKIPQENRALNDITSSTLSLLKELGLSPSARAKMRVAKTPADNSVEDLFNDV